MTTLSAVLVTPLSGPLARYGIAGAAALRLWATRAPGLPAPWSTVDLQLIDAYPSAAAAMRSAVVDRPDVLFGPYGTGPALAALSATARAVWNHGGATTRLRRPAFAQALNILAPASTYFVGVLQAIRAADADARRVCLLTGRTSFGQEVAHGAAAASRALSFDLWAGVFAPGQGAAFASGVPAGDVLLVAGGFEDELAAARLLLGRGWRAAGFVAAGVGRGALRAWRAARRAARASAMGRRRGRAGSGRAGRRVVRQRLPRRSRQRAALPGRGGIRSRGAGSTLPP